MRRPLQTQRKLRPASGTPLLLATDKTPHAAIILPDNPSTSSKQAAALLRDYFTRISKARLIIANEAGLKTIGKSFEVNGQPVKSLIAIGTTLLAQKAGIKAGDLAPGGYRLQTRDNVLYLVGQDTTPAQLSVYGTRNGAYALLENYFGVRWLWPGEGGTVIKPESTLTLAPLNESDQPVLGERRLWNGYPAVDTSMARRRLHTAMRRLQRSQESYAAKRKQSPLWFDAMRLGNENPIRYAQGFFTDWWPKYGATHPEYFALQPDGTRSQDAGAAHSARLDVSNPQLIEAVANQAIEYFRANPNARSFSLSPNDGGPQSFCMCEACRRLDPPNAPTISFRYHKDGKPVYIDYPSLSDRYVSFYARVAEIVNKQYPDRLFGAYAYSTYKTPPLYARLPSNVVIGFVGLTYFNEETRLKDRANWDGWTRAATQLFVRPNALHGGYGFPAVYVHKLDEDIKHMYQTGMIAGNFDAVLHNWASHGLNYYVLAKLLWDPSQNVDDIVQDYCKQGFGTAAPAMQRYFSELEKLTNTIAETRTDVDNSQVEDDLSQYEFWRNVKQMTRMHYTRARIGHLQTILNEAKRAAGKDKQVQARIVFLEQGLRYSRVEGDALRALFAPENAAKQQLVLQALKKRQEVFKDIYQNHFYAQNVLYPLNRETTAWQKFGWKPDAE